jgi:hypothetical protein
VPRFREDGEVVLTGQDGPEKLHRGHVDGSVGQAVEDDGKPADGARGRHAVVRRVVGQVEIVEAVLVDRSPAFAKMCLAPEEHRKMRDELDGVLALVCGDSLQPSEEGVIRQPGRVSKSVFMHDRV